MCKSKSITRNLVALGAMVLLALLQTQTTKAQSTIFNIPSTDVVAKHKTYFEFDFLSHLASHVNGGFQSYVPRAVFGVAKGVEAGVNLAVTDIGGPKLVEIQPNVKWQFYSNEKSGVAATVGGIAYLPAKQRAAFANNNFGFIYANVSKKLKAMKGARFTGGGYGLVGRKAGFGTKGGAMAGYEQPLSAKVSFVADWFSGKNRFGLVTPGFSFTVSKSSILNVGYSINNWHNGGGRANALFVYYGITF
jgi:hypothetical protein